MEIHGINMDPKKGRCISLLNTEGKIFFQHSESEIKLF